MTRDDQSTIEAVRRLTRTASWAVRLAWRFIGPRCAHCGAAGDLGAIDLCAACLRALPWQAMTLQGGACVPFGYLEPVAGDLRALKFRGDLRTATLYGTLLAAEILHRQPAEARPALLVPVPLHAARRAQRGFNQAARIARQVGRWLDIPVREDLLMRSRSTVPQTALPADRRRANMVGAFASTPALAAMSPKLEGRAVAIVDDVWTTGATLAAAERALCEGGVKIIQRWAVARTMPTKTASPTH